MNKITRESFQARKWALSLVGAAMLSAAAIGPAMAADTVTTSVTCGTTGSLAASFADASLAPVTSSTTVQASTGNMTLTAVDPTCTAAGWNVTTLVGDFAYTGSVASGEAIPAENFTLTSAGGATVLTGQAIDATGGPNVGTTSGSFDAAIETISANAEFGQGSYTQVLGVSLSVPALSAVGTYTGDLTVTITAGP